MRRTQDQQHLYNLGSGSWLAWATERYVAIRWLRQWTIGPVVCSSHIPLLQSAIL